MLAQWLYSLSSLFGPLNVFRYITFRAAAACATAFFIALVAGHWIIRWLRGRQMLEDTSKPDAAKLDELHRGKRNTPTMGGLILLASVPVSAILWASVTNFYILLGLGVFLALSLLGLADDLLKLNYKRTRKGIRGLTKRLKFIPQFVIGLLAAWALWLHASGAPVGGAIYLPFFKDISLTLGAGIIVWGAFIVAATSNAVNITDGLDGLATGCAAVTCLALAGVTYVTGRPDFSAYLFTPAVPGASELCVLAAALLGALLGFLWYNCHPAEVFMGDTGSLPLGGLIGFIALAVKHEVLLLLIGLVFVAEVTSVILQIGSYQTTGKRIFPIAPFHHALEYLGWNENKITIRLWILAALAAGFGLVSLKLR